MRIRSVCTIVGLSLIGLVSNPAQAQSCKPISSVPTTITAAGVYCLTRNLNYHAASGAAIQIEAGNVVLDFKGYRLNNTAGRGTEAVAVRAHNRQEITVRNGGTRAFLIGVQFTGTPAKSIAHVVEDMRFHLSRYAGVDIHGRGNIVRRNHVVNTGNSTSVAARNSGYGLRMTGVGCRLIENDVERVIRSFEGGASNPFSAGLFAACDNAIFLDNRVSDSYAGFANYGSAKMKGQLSIGISVNIIGDLDLVDQN